MAEKIIRVEHLQQFFPVGGFGKNKKYVRAVDDVSFYIEKGETLGLVGESGCGKTTTGRSLLRLYEPTDGRIIYKDQVLFDSGKVPLVDENGNDIIENGVPKLGKKTAVNMYPYRKKLQIVFQDPYASLDPRMTVGDIIGEAIDINKIAASKQDRHDKIIEVINLHNSEEEIKKLIDCKKYFPAYHMNKKHWCTICLDGTVELKEIYKLIDISYELAE